MADINVEIAASLGRFEREMAKVESRLTKLANSVEKKASSQLGRVDASAAQTAANLNRMVQSADKAGAAAGKFGGSLQQVGFQIGDFATQVGAGTSATQALGQQLPQLLGAFGTFGALAGAAAAVMIPLGSALLKTALDSETLEERMKALEKSTDAMREASEQAAIPLDVLRQKYGALADEVARANGVAAAFATMQAKSDLFGTARAAAGAGRLAVGGRIRDISAPGGYRDATEDEARAAAAARMAKEYGASADQAERLLQAQRRLETSNSVEVVARDAENLLSVWLEISRNADAPVDKILAIATPIQGVMKQAAAQVEAQRSAIARLIEEYDAGTAKLKSLADDLAKAEDERAKASAAGKTEEVAQWDRVIAKIREMVYETRAAASETDTLFERMTKGAQGFLDRAGKFAKGYVSPEGFESRYIEERARGAGSKNEEAVRAATAAAEQLGVAAKDLLAVMSFESGINPGRRGGAGGKYLGLIQFSPENQRRYGVNENQSIAQQMGAVVKYLKDTGVKPGMGIEHIYAAILAGDARRINASDRKNGGIVDNVYADTHGEKYRPHINKAEGLLAAYPDIVQAENEALKEQKRLQDESAAALKKEVAERERKAEAMQKAREALSADLISQQKAAELDRQRAEAIGAINASGRSDAEKAAAIAQVNAEMERQVTVMALMEEAKRRDVKLDEQMLNSTMTYLQAIEALGEAKAAQVIADQEATAAADRLKQAQDFAAQQTQALKDGLVDAIVEGENFSDVLAGVAKSLAKAALQAALFGEGPMASLFGGKSTGGGLLGGLFSGLFGGARANGGPVTGGMPYLVGERGPEIIVPRSAGQVIPNHALGGSTFAPSNTIVINGDASERTVALIRQELAANNRQMERLMPAKINAVNRDPLRRG